ncbi:MAG: PhzF family phenazine biosynthesis protein, partial [Candidatus Omnitrophica bacterium]|nr:PhzF family phenazine biosynthesis protein [Candidatus Omnitrophota bacterium]
MPIHHVDAFATHPFEGNPAAVCLLSSPADPQWMQSLARDLNLSETAFIEKRPDGFSLRWFTPTVEVDLCGHATLASAHVLWESGTLAPEERAVFFTRGGRLTATRRGEWIELNFPADTPIPVGPPADTKEALGVVPLYVFRGRIGYLFELADETRVRELSPDISRIAKWDGHVIVTGRATTPGFDFVSRFFGPRAGIPEDPVTGSAHCCLGPYWKARLNKSRFVAYQASARGGVVKVGFVRNRVLLIGQAVTI